MTDEHTEFETPSTRPKTAPRTANRAAQRRVIRYTLDLDATAHRGLKLLSYDLSVSSSIIMRNLLMLLDSPEPLPGGRTLRDILEDVIFAEEDSDE